MNGFTHGPARSPTVDGIVKRNPDGKERRFVTQLSDEEQEIARKVCLAFKQNICGLDLLRVRGKSYVIDVNGWSFVKGNDDYYDMCAKTMREFFLSAARIMKVKLPRSPSFEGSWRLKGYISVLRHGDRIFHIVLCLINSSMHM